MRNEPKVESASTLHQPAMSADSSSIVWPLGFASELHLLGLGG